MPNILFVCTANQCRSPMAAAAFLDLLARQGEQGWGVASAGTWAEPGRSMTKSAVRALRRRGLPTPQHRARVVDEELLRWSDLVVVMEQGHKEALTVEFPGHAGKVRLLTELCGGSGNIADPIGQPDHMYEATLRQMSECLEASWPRIRALLDESP